MFCIEDDHIVAVFPKERFYPASHSLHREVITAYAHIGQHSACHIEYYKALKPCENELQFKSLKKELEGLGYELKVLNSKD